MAEGENIYVGRNEPMITQGMIDEYMQFLQSIGATAIIAPGVRLGDHQGQVYRPVVPNTDDQCRSCRFWCGQTHNGNTLVCAVHPNGVEGVCGDREV